MKKQKLNETEANQQISRKESRIPHIFSPYIALKASNGQLVGKRETIR